MPNEVELLLPKAIADAGSTKLTPRPESLDGKTLGFLWNSKPNADMLFEEFVSQVGDRYALKDVKRHRKPSAATGATPDILDSIQRDCDVAVVALGD